MEQTTLGYLGVHALYHVREFFRHWYVKSARMYMNFVLNKLATLDTFFAWRITFAHLFEPLYGDYSFLGYVLGFFFRMLRFILGTVVYIFIFAFAIFCYLLWIFAPLYAISRVILG